MTSELQEVTIYTPLNQPESEVVKPETHSQIATIIETSTEGHFDLRTIYHAHLDLQTIVNSKIPATYQERVYRHYLLHLFQRAEVLFAYAYNISEIITGRFEYEMPSIFDLIKERLSGLESLKAQRELNDIDVRVDNIFRYALNQLLIKFPNT